MLGLEISFDLGRYHANPWGSHVNDAATEWPPSPWRLIRALYSTARTNVNLAQRRTVIDRALQALMDAPPPVFELPAVSAAHTRHYMPKANYSALHPGDTAKVLDGFLAVDPRTPLAAWWDTALDAEAADALSAVARGLGYLGRSESVCSARIVAGAGPRRVSAAPADSVETHDDEWELVDLLCPQRGQPIDTLAVSVTEMRRSRRLIPPGALHVTYSVSRVEVPPATERIKAVDAPPTLAVFRLRGSGRAAITEAVAVGQALRSALQHEFGARNGGVASPTFSGRRGDEPRSDQHRHAHYLALTGDEGPRVDRLVVWAPEGFGAHEVEALAGVSYLKMREIPERLPTALVALATESELRLRKLLGPARSWRSVTPFGLVRHPKVRGGQLLDSPADQVRRELAQRGLPEPDRVILERGSWHRFRSSKVGRSRLERAALFGIRLAFSEPVPGPLALGAFSHFGLGLFRIEER